MRTAHLAAIVCISVASPNASQPGSPETLATRVRSGDWQVRRAALEQIVSDAGWISSDESVQFIVELQDQENRTLQALPDDSGGAERMLGTAYMEYYLWDLGPATDRILQERPSRSAVAVFAKRAYSPGTVYAELLARTGAIGVPAFTDLAADPDPSMRSKAASVLQIMMERESQVSASERFPPAIRAAVTSALVRLADDEISTTRKDAAIGLGYSDDPAAIAVLERLAAHDPYVRPNGYSPVRAAAAEALARLKARLRR